MAVTILEALQNANHNIDNVKFMGMSLLPPVKRQLNNAVVLLEKGYPLDQEVEPLLEEYGDVDNVPDKEDEEYGEFQVTLESGEIIECNKDHCTLIDDKEF